MISVETGSSEVYFSSCYPRREVKLLHHAASPELSTLYVCGCWCAILTDWLLCCHAVLSCCAAMLQGVQCKDSRVQGCAFESAHKGGFVGLSARSSSATATAKGSANTPWMWCAGHTHNPQLSNRLQAAGCRLPAQDLPLCDMLCCTLLS
jgi:hypothetical protein